MGRFVQGGDRRQDVLLPASLDDYVSEDNPVRVLEAFIDELDFHPLGFAGATPAETGRPAYHPSTMLKIYLLRLSRQNSVEQATGARGAAQYRIDVADWPIGTGLLDDRQLSTGQW